MSGRHEHSENQKMHKRHVRMLQRLAWTGVSHPNETEKPHTRAALATEVHCEVQKHSDKEEEENEGQTRGSLLETH